MFVVQFSRKKGSIDDLYGPDRTVVAQILGMVMLSMSQFSKDGMLERYAEEIIRERRRNFCSKWCCEIELPKLCITEIIFHCWVIPGRSGYGRSGEVLFEAQIPTIKFCRGRLDRKNIDQIPETRIFVFGSRF